MWNYTVKLGLIYCTPLLKKSVYRHNSIDVINWKLTEKYDASDTQNSYYQIFHSVGENIMDVM